MDKRLLLIMLVSLIIILPIVAYIVHIIDRKDKIKVNTGALLYIKNSKGNSWFKVYSFFCRFFITRRYLDKISRRYELLCPGDRQAAAVESMKVAFSVWVITAAEIYFIFLMKPSFHNCIVALYLAYVVNNEIINRLVENTEIRLLEQMSIFITEVSHNYHINRLVDEAILKSMDGLGYEMRLHAERLLRIITSNNMREDVIQYNTTIHNRYLKMFLSLSTSIIEYNDKVVNGQLLFTSNLRHLIREINIEILKLKRLKFYFTGTVFVTVAVCLPIDAIQSFGISLVPELEDFYMGQGGIIFVGAIIISSMLIYRLINNLKDMNQVVTKDYRYLRWIERVKLVKRGLNNYTERHYGRMQLLNETLKKIGETITPRQLMIKRLMAGIIAFILCIGLTIYIHSSSRYYITDKVTNIQSLTSAANLSQSDKITEAIKIYVNRYKDEAVTKDYIIKELTSEELFYNSLVNELIADEVIERISSYQAEYFKWYELMACLIASVIFYNVPYLMVVYKKKVLGLAMEDEINQFNSIIYMLMYIDHMTVKEILVQLELFAMVFKTSIMECINEYNSGDIEALTRMKDKESFAPFKRMADNLIRCDLISIDKAFNEIATDRENYHDRRKQENEIAVSRRADVAKPLSFIPAVMVTIYLLLPLFVASMNELAGFKENLSGLGF